MNFKKVLSNIKQARNRAFHDVMREMTSNALSLFVRDNWDLISDFARSRGVTIPKVDVEDTNPKDLEGIINELFLTNNLPGPLRAARAFDTRIKASSEYDFTKLTALRDHFSKALAVTLSIGPHSSDEERARSRILVEHVLGALPSAAARSITLKSRLDHEGTPDAPEVVIYQGGGARAMAYLGVHEDLEDRGLAKGIKYVAGTSAGALIGLPIALGCSTETIRQIMLEGRFAQFFASSTKLFRAGNHALQLLGLRDIRKDPALEGKLLVKFAKNHFLPELEAALSGSTLTVHSLLHMPENNLQHELSMLDKPHRHHNKLEHVFNRARESFEESMRRAGKEHLVKALDFSGLCGREAYYQGALTSIRINRSKRIEGDAIESFLGDIVQHRVSLVSDSILQSLRPEIRTVEEMRDITFDQLRQLTVLAPHMGFKELGVAITETKWVITGNKAVTCRAGEGYVDMPIKKAVRASMNLPLIFRAVKHNGKSHFDGGITNNFGISIFSDKFSSPAEYGRKLRGYMLSTMDNDVEARLYKKYLKSRVLTKIPLLEVITGLPAQALKKIKRMSIKGYLGGAVENFMDANNKSQPEQTDFRNIAFISTGRVSTDQFNIDKRERVLLANSGYMASSFLNGFDYDPAFRYAITRMTALAKIETRLLQKAGKRGYVSEEQLKSGLAALSDPVFQANTHDEFTYALANSRLKESNDWDSLLRM